MKCIALYIFLIGTAQASQNCLVQALRTIQLPGRVSVTSTESLLKIAEPQIFDEAFLSVPQVRKLVEFLGGLNEQDRLRAIENFLAKGDTKEEYLRELEAWTAQAARNCE